MRAWLLLLTVLATFKPIVQVASTEDITSKFITAITTPTAAAAAATTTTAAATATATTTALTKSYQPVIKDTAASSSSTTTTSLTSSSIAAAAAVAPAVATSLLYQNSDSDSNSNNNSDNNLIIDIKNIEEIEGAVNKSEEEVEELERTVNINQLENSNKISSDSSVLQQEKMTFKAEAEEEQNIAHKSTESTFTSGETSSTTTTTDHIDDKHDQHAHQQHQQHKHEHQHHHHHQHHQHHQQQQQHHQQHHHKTAVATEDPISDSSSSSSGSSSTIDISDDEHDTPNDIDSEPETYSNKEIISEKLKPDPSTLVEIENSLLSLFNMKRPPKIDRSKIIIPEAMKQLYAQIMGHEIDSVNLPKPGLLTKSANTVRSFTHQDSKIDERFPHHHRFRLHFDVKSIPSNEKLKAAELQLSRDTISHAALNPRQANRTRYQILVYDITRVGIRGKREPSYLLLDNKTIRLNSTDTVSLDVQPAVDRWLESPKKNYGLLIEVRTFRSLKPAPHHHVRLRRSADEPHDDWQHKQPLLFTYTDDGRHKSRSIRDVSTRSKRAGQHHKSRRRKNQETCRRHSLYVDFSDVGWSDWIVAPPGYDAYYCHGKCAFPLADHLNSTNHAVVQTLVNNINPGKVPKACCVPTQLTGISMLYLNDQNTVVLKNYQDMTVVGCGCR